MHYIILSEKGVYYKWAKDETLTNKSAAHSKAQHKNGTGSVMNVSNGQIAASAHKQT